MDAAEVLASPYVRICIRPRATIREIVDRDPRYMVIALVVIASLAGVVANLIGGANPTAFTISGKPIPLVNPHRWWMINLAGVVVAPLFAIAFLYLNGAVLRWSGALLGGTAKAVEVRAALAWAAIPGIVVYAVNVLMRLAIPHPPAIAPRDFHAMMAETRRMLPAIAVNLAFIVWVGVIMLKCVGEVHRFSAWRALGAWLIGALALMGGALVAAVVVLLAIVPFLR